MVNASLPPSTTLRLERKHNSQSHSDAIAARCNRSILHRTAPHHRTALHRTMTLHQQHMEGNKQGLQKKIHPHPHTNTHHPTTCTRLRLRASPNPIQAHLQDEHLALVSKQACVCRVCLVCRQPSNRTPRSLALSAIIKNQNLIFSRPFLSR